MRMGLAFKSEPWYRRGVAWWSIRQAIYIKTTSLNACGGFLGKEDGVVQLMHAKAKHGKVSQYSKQIYHSKI